MRVEESRVDSLRDFQRESAELSRSIGLAYNQAAKLKGMFDGFESIPTKQQKMYDDVMKVMSDLAEVKSKSYSVEMKLKRYR
tara:strand:+ start:1810 stop:2055 length:246 start_codon:yes stop_codon:yes gene_type:complete